jgi:pimeloyl-ACP methyl ester carboxylesterase
MKDTRPRIAWVRVGGRPARYQVHARADGGALPVLLVHGIACSSFAFLPTLERAVEVGEPRRVFAPDMPGYGRSPGPRRALNIPEMGAWLLDFIDTLAIPRVHVIGNSMGSQVAMAMARQAPARVASLMLTGPTTGDQYQSFWRYGFGLLADQFLESPVYTFRLATMALQMGVRRFVPTVRHLLRDHPIALADQVVCPTLVVRGARDPIISRKVVQRLAAALPRGEYVELAGVGHSVQHDSAKTLWALARPLFARHDDDASSS